MKPNVVRMPSGAERERRRPAPAAPSARDRAERPGRGRAWINGREVGGTDARFRHLHCSYD